jgi:hypothetical protein
VASNQGRQTSNECTTLMRAQTALIIVVYALAVLAQELKLLCGQHLWLTLWHKQHSITLIFTWGDSL